MAFTTILITPYKRRIIPLQSYMIRTRKNIKILFRYIIGPLLGAWLFYSLYKQIKGQPDLQQSIDLIKEAPFGGQAWKFWLVISLVFVNWGFEAKKWQVLLKSLQPVSFFTAYKSVLSGVTLSINTPNRIGEYGGRILYVQEGKRIKAISLSIAGSISQLIITLMMGCFGLVYIIFSQGNNYTLVMGLPAFWLKTLLFLSSCATMIIVLFYFR
ncbi:MAG: lysylphosphatidylglycerol synthase domain-containing protein, partial [Ginsengibacter sp.]